MDSATQKGYREKLSRQIALRLDSGEIDAVDRFADRFFHRIVPEDLQGRSPEDDAGLIIDSWKRLIERSPQTTQIHVSNPVHARDGWHSRHTIVRVMLNDMPFAVDSVLMALSHNGQVTHLLNNMVFALERHEGAVIQPDLPVGDGQEKALLVYAEVDRLADDELAGLKTRLDKTLTDLEVVVADFERMKEKLGEVIEKSRRVQLPEAEVAEALAFMNWLAADKFTFLGFREFEYLNDGIRQVGEPLGMLRQRLPASERVLSEQPERTRHFLLEPKLLSFSKSGTRSRVHRPAYPDYVGIKQFNDAGEVVGEFGFLGLYTSRVYMEHPSEIPFVRRKIADVVARSDFDPKGFDGKVLEQVLATYPRDELFQITEDALFETALAITNIHERRLIRVYTRIGNYGLFVNCLIYLPRDLFNTRARLAVEKLLHATFDAEDLDYDIFLSESILARLQYTIRIRPGSSVQFDRVQLERRISELVSDWSTELSAAFVEAFGETQGRRHLHEYADAFPAGYREDSSVRVAVDDVVAIQQLSVARSLFARFYRLPEDSGGALRLKVFHLGETMVLSDLIMKLENMGLLVIGEQPHRIRRASGPVVVIHDFLLSYERQLDLSGVGDRFNEALLRIWDHRAEDDGFNRLILGADLSWRQVAVLRTYARYLKQIRFGFGEEFISDTLIKHARLSRCLLDYFESRFAVDAAGSTTGSDSLRRRTERLEQEIVEALEAVALLNEDRILRRFLELINATKRTNYFQRIGELAKPYLSLKLAPGEISDMPRPVPFFEIFVCAPHFEGVHLRGGAIARGGLRWSDRLEDYRTEVLGLVKAQIVKNGVIVPTGAKGGFVLKTTRGSGKMPEVVDCYREFISGLLDLTDNLVAGKIVPPPDLIRYDSDDPYLVVAADKGTATFSDEANAVSAQYEFWLGDAFASGGSNGYDHKKMGITARGAWVSVQRHFRERGVDIQTEPFTVLGIGDMSGDVFGNGMLLSPAIELVAAFNHRFIFVDPNPDIGLSFAERRRLFELPRSSWEDYDASLISDGGGVFSRQLKAIELSEPVRRRFEIDADRLSPDELIHALLCSPVQLIWNGGIGTYVRSSQEGDAEVGDRANDHLRVSAPELQAQVFGEGGNLGMTQRGRIEFALRGGSVNTDFIDNSAGVDCSDHEVNIKILLNEVVSSGDMTPKQRNLLLEDMEEEVTELVLQNNRSQTRTLSLATRHSQSRLSEYQRFMSRMEVESNLDRTLENLPGDEELAERVGSTGGLTRPELSVLLAYAKIHIKDALVASNVDEDPIMALELLRAFPQTLSGRFQKEILNHGLKKEILASQLANGMVDYMGITYVVHLLEFVGSSVEVAARAHLSFAEAFGLRSWCDAIEAQPVSEGIKLDLLVQVMRLGRRATRWIVRHRRELSDVRGFIARFQPRVRELINKRELLMSASDNADWRAVVSELKSAGVSEDLAKQSAKASRLADSLPIIDASDATGAEVVHAAEVFVCLSDRLGTDWLAEQLASLVPASHWQSMERDALLDDVMSQQGMLAAEVLTHAAGDVDVYLNDRSQLAADWRQTIFNAQQGPQQDFSMFAMTCRKLIDLRRVH